MVKKIFSMVFCWGLTANSFAADRCTVGGEFEPSLCPLTLPKITRLRIKENAAKSPLEKDVSVSCVGFKITEGQVRRYFAKAGITSENDAHHTLDWSPCYASGEMDFSDGRHGQWKLNQYRTGYLKITGSDALVLYCPRCKFKPFQW